MLFSLKTVNHSVKSQLSVLGIEAYPEQLSTQEAVGQFLGQWEDGSATQPRNLSALLPSTHPS